MGFYQSDGRFGSNQQTTRTEERRIRRRAKIAILFGENSKQLLLLEPLGSSTTSFSPVYSCGTSSNHNRGAEVGVQLPICLSNWLFIASPPLQSHLYSNVSCGPNPYSTKLDESLPVSDFYRKQDRSISHVIQLIMQYISHVHCIPSKKYYWC